jgi:hypothetical protein
MLKDVESRIVKRSATTLEDFRRLFATLEIQHTKPFANPGAALGLAALPLPRTTSAFAQMSELRQNHRSTYMKIPVARYPGLRVTFTSSLLSATASISQRNVTGAKPRAGTVRGAAGESEMSHHRTVRRPG